MLKTCVCVCLIAALVASDLCHRNDGVATGTVWRSVAIR